MRMPVPSLASNQWVKDQALPYTELQCKLQTWLGSGLLLWLWCRQATVTPILPPAWELPYAAGEALKVTEVKYTDSHFLFLFIIIYYFLFYFLSFCLFWGRSHGTWRFLV